MIKAERNLRKEINDRFVEAYRYLKENKKIKKHSRGDDGRKKLLMALFGNANRGSLLTDIIRGDRLILTNQIPPFCKTYGISEIWMLTGLGDMKKSYKEIETNIENEKEKLIEQIRINKESLEQLEESLSNQ